VELAAVIVPELTDCLEGLVEELLELNEEMRMLKAHVMKLEGIIQVMLEELGSGSIEDSADRILEVLEEGRLG